MEKINILAVDDRRENLLAIEAVLTNDAIRLYRATSGQEALALMLDVEFALVLLDVQMPDMDGFETAELMRSNEKTKYTPIIFVTAISKEEKHVFRGYESGAVDYLFKPLDPEILRSKVRIFLELHRQKAALKEGVEALKQANQQLIEQQKKKIEEERLKLLFQLAGATAHELNQPLMTLLGHIETMRAGLTASAEAAGLLKSLDGIEVAGRRIAEVVQKVQAIQQDRIRRQERATAHDDAHQGVRILYVEDEQITFRAIQIMIQDNHYQLDHAATVKEGIAKLGETAYQLVLLDYNLPDGTGLDFMEAMASAGIDIPVVILTATNDEVLAAKMIQKGAYEYVSKGDVRRKALARVIHQALEKSALKRDLIAVQQRMADLAFTDELTGVFNRRYVFEELAREIAAFGRYQDEMSLCIIDLDHFKAVNDTYGHLAGDLVLAETAQLLNRSLRGSDVLGRYGGEEFVVIFPDTPVEKARAVCERFRCVVADHLFIYNDHRIRQTISVGVAGYQHRMTLETLIEQADKAMYGAKTTGRNKVVVAQTG